MRKAILAASAALLLAAPAAAVNLVNNGSFETGNFTGWSAHGDDSFTFVTDELSGGGPTDGIYHAEFGPDAFGYLYQQIPTVAGRTYHLSFDLANLGGLPNNFAVFWGSTVPFELNDAGGFDYTHLAFTLVAEASETALTFRTYNVPSFWLLDNVSLVAVPEPGTWAMLISGFGLVGAAARRKTRAVRQEGQRGCAR